MTKANAYSHLKAQRARSLLSGVAGRLSFKSLMNYKTLLLLTFVLVMNLVASFLVLGVDLFVHGELYQYGLIYSQEWADQYWIFTIMLWVFLGGATALIFASIVPHYMHSRKVSRLSTWTGFFLPISALSMQGIGVFYLNQKNSIVMNTLRDYGVQYVSTWTTAYSLVSVPAFVLMVVAILALIVPPIRAAGYEIQITRD